MSLTDRDYMKAGSGYSSRNRGIPLKARLAFFLWRLFHPKRRQNGSDRETPNSKSSTSN